MSYRRRHRWFRRMALGLAFASVMFAGRVSVATAKLDEGTRVAPPAEQVIPYLSHGILSEADAEAAAAQAIHDPYLTDLFVRPGEGVGRPDGDQIAIQNALEERLAAPPVIPYLSHGILTESDAQAALKATIAEPFVPGVTDFPSRPVETAAVRPDDVADRFVHSDVTSAPQVVSSSSGSTIEWNEAVTAGIGLLVLGLGLGLAFGHLRRPKVVGL